MRVFSLHVSHGSNQPGFVRLTSPSSPRGRRVRLRPHTWPRRVCTRPPARLLLRLSASAHAGEVGVGTVDEREVQLKRILRKGEIESMYIFF